MFSPLFWFFAALTLAFGLGVVVNRNPVASALCLVVSFMGLAALLVGLDAYLLAVLQVLVYAGAVMVLFLFIIMLLDLRAEARRKFNWLGIAGGGLVALAFVGELVFVISRHPAGNEKFPALVPAEVWGSSTDLTHGFHYRPLAASAAVNSTAADARPTPAPKPSRSIDDVREIGREIFTNYNFPLQVVAVLLLVATVGVIILSRRELK
jgi:NADH-quinone oxidoreductase subunit J